MWRLFGHCILLPVSCPITVAEPITTDLFQGGLDSPCSVGRGSGLQLLNSATWLQKTADMPCKAWSRLIRRVAPGSLQPIPCSASLTAAVEGSAPPAAAAERPSAVHSRSAPTPGNQWIHSVDSCCGFIQQVGIHKALQHTNCPAGS